MKNLFSAILFFTIIAPVCEATTTDVAYKEKWRPQYHFTPAHRWIGDPCGLVHFDGKFHAYSWGAAESTDLIHWTEINDNAITGLPKGIAPFTGSVVIDRNNSAGYGDNAFIAAFTSFDEHSKKQSQSIAFSHDHGKSFQYYDLNPVLDIWSTEFRDPTVIWDRQNNRWVMLVAKALEKKVAFYSSPDLKRWHWESDFGPEGDSEKSWECPDLFRLPVQGTDLTKWVLVVSVNWAREQYFVGEFDGTKFTPDSTTPRPQYVDAGLDFYASRTFQDFDGTLPGVYSIGWVSTWDYAQHVPTEYGKGVWSIPRELSLVKTADGYRLVQTPVSGLSSLRGKAYRFNRNLKPGVTNLPSVAHLDNQYELIADFSTKNNDTFGLNLCSGNKQQISLTYDVKSRTLLLDRTNVSETTIPKFERIAFAKVAPVNDVLSLDIFVDKSVIEVFANGGQCVMTALVFPSESATDASVFTLEGNTHADITVFPIKTIWDKTSTAR